MTNKLTNVKAMELAIELAQGNDELVEKLGKIKASFEKKASGEKKPTATQLENAKLRDAIVEFLANGEKYTITELIKACPALEGLSTQKVTPLVKGLESEHIVVVTVDKRKNYYALA